MSVAQPEESFEVSNTAHAPEILPPSHPMTPLMTHDLRGNIVHEIYEDSGDENSLESGIVTANLEYVWKKESKDSNQSSKNSSKNGALAISGIDTAKNRSIELPPKCGGLFDDVCNNVIVGLAIVSFISAVSAMLWFYQLWKGTSSC
mmetsp:Transcript_34774/g.51052  ORF Transcript_34774/g.51052 Transcript_34774/m.51052 type:complete len:147 (+) Transcript_34774:194-634(+)